MIFCFVGETTKKRKEKKTERNYKNFSKDQKLRAKNKRRATPKIKNNGQTAKQKTETKINKKTKNQKKKRGQNKP